MVLLIFTAMNNTILFAVIVVAVGLGVGLALGIVLRRGSRSYKTQVQRTSAQQNPAAVSSPAVSSPNNPGQATQPPIADLVGFLGYNKATGQDLFRNKPLMQGAELQRLQQASTSQTTTKQDLFVAQILSYLQAPGFFVEFGAADGKTLSNTYMLENTLGWSGILAEPSLEYRDILQQHRPRTTVDLRCVWKEGGQELTFRQAGYLSTIDAFTMSDGHGKKRASERTTYQVPTVTLEDLLIEHGAPATVHYMSVDTEGSEYEILQQFFASGGGSRFTVLVFTIEHNFTASQGRIQRLMKDHGYIHVLPEASSHDDFFIHENVLRALLASQ